MRASVRHNMVWSMTSIVVKNGCQVITYMLLARLLDPASFGLIAITMVGMGLAYSLVDSGFTNVVVRQQSLDRNVLTSLYWFNLSLGILAAALLAVAGHGDRGSGDHMQRLRSTVYRHPAAQPCFQGDCRH
jgi:O-antigen/teichoic acid export membrane protein